MVKNILIILAGILLGVVIEYLFIFYPTITAKDKSLDLFAKKQVIGFLPYWLLSKAQTDYSKYINTLAYFSLTVDIDGKILKFNKPLENEPGWYTLKSGKADTFLNQTPKNYQKLSVVVFNGDEASIAALMENPIVHAKNLISDIKPIMQQYNFTDLNLDIESTKIASDEARLHFSQFIREVKRGMKDNNLGTLTIDVSSDSLIKKRLIDISAVVDLVDYIVLMAYDYHYSGSQVTGPVAPLFGAGIDSEYDTQAATEIALKEMPAKKIILGMPLYGYEWETLRKSTRSATIPSSGLTASTHRVEDLLNSCATCSAQTDNEAQERYVIFKDSTGSFHQIFYPDAKSTSVKIDFARNEKLGGVALWALGYESSNILIPLVDYK